jgi:protease I
MNESNQISGKKIAILATDGFEQSELMEPKEALEEAGAETFVVSPKSGRIKGWSEMDWGKKVKVDISLAEADAQEFDGLLLPGGVMNPDKLRMEKDAIRFVQAFMEAGKPIGAICHGPWTLIDAGAVEGRKMTSWPSIRTDLENAGAEWVDEEVVVDNGLVTSRKPDDIPAFTRKFMEELGEGVHNRMEGTARISGSRQLG